MKKLPLNTKNNFKNFAFIVSCLISVSLWAGSVAVVDTVSGNVFASKDGKIWPLRPMSEINDFTEIITEEGAQVSFHNFHDHQYHLSGSGKIKILNRMAELKSGYLWVQSWSQKPSSIQTANGNISFAKGESIISFDPSTGKTQLLVVNGNFTLANSLESTLAETIKPGEFSFIDQKYNDGNPRVPTQVGESSFKAITSLFKDITPMAKGTTKYKVASKNKKPKRTIASVEKKNDWGFGADMGAQPEKGTGFYEPIQKQSVSPRAPSGLIEKGSSSDNGGVIFLRKKKKVTRGPANFSMKNYYQKEKAKIYKRKRARNPRDYSRKSQVPVKIFGLGHTHSGSTWKKSNPIVKSVKEKVTRTPASVKAKWKKQIPKSPVVGPRSYSEYEKSLVDEFGKQMRHSNEVNSLIKDLESVRTDLTDQY